MFDTTAPQPQPFHPLDDVDLAGLADPVAGVVAAELSSCFVRLCMCATEPMVARFAGQEVMLRTPGGIELSRRVYAQQLYRRIDADVFHLLRNCVPLEHAESALSRIEAMLREKFGDVVETAASYLLSDDRDTAIEIMNELTSQIQPNARSYGLVIKGALATKEGRYGDAVDALRSGLELTDSWLLRFYLGRAYFEAGRYIEALDEFEVAVRRRGEAAALFLDDDEPTWRYMRSLNEWLANAREKANFHPSATN